MSQTTFDDDDLFGEAADEVREDVQNSLGEARASLPDPDEIWETEAENVLGVLNGLRSSMDPGEAEEHLRDAKKWYTMAERADAFDDADELAAEIEAVEEVIAEMRTARDQVSDLAGSVPQLRSALEDARTESEDAGEEADDEDTEEATADTEDAADEDGSDAEADGGKEAAADGGEAEGEEGEPLDDEDDEGDEDD